MPPALNTIGLPPPSSFSYRSHCQNQQESRRVLSTTVYGLAWSPDGNFLAACSSYGVICLWDILGDDGGCSTGAEPISLKSSTSQTVTSSKKKRRKGCILEDYWVQNEQDEKTNGPGKGDPVLRIQASQGTLYDLKFQTMNSTTYLIVCGDDGVLVFQWRVILEELHQRAANDPIKTIKVAPVRTFCPHPSATEKSGVEINCVSCDEDLNTLYAAAGDLFGCYRWDFETGVLLGTLAGQHTHSHSDYLHSVRAVPGKHHILTGGEDGKMGVWDGKEGKLVEMMDCRSETEKRKSLVTTDATLVGNNENKLWGNDSHLWVSSIDVDECGNWGVACGGVEGKRISFQGTHGFLTMWNLPTRTLTSGHATRESIQSVSFHDGLENIVSVGNEAVVSYWSRSKASREGRAWISPPSGFAISVHSDNAMMAVGGASNLVDVFADTGNRAFSMSFQ